MVEAGEFAGGVGGSLMEDLAVAGTVAGWGDFFATAVHGALEERRYPAGGVVVETEGYAPTTGVGSACAQGQFDLGDVLPGYAAGAEEADNGDTCGAQDNTPQGGSYAEPGQEDHEGVVGVLLWAGGGGSG